MTPQQIEAMKMALDLATMHHTDDGYAALRAKVRSASKEALAQPEQEPDDGYCKACDGWKCTSKAGCVALDNPSQRTEQEPEAWYDKHGMVTHDPFEGVTPLYLTPPQRKPLTHEQRLDLITEFEKHRMKWDDIGILIDLVEAAHGIKENT